MGWFFNPNNNQSDSNNHQDSQNHNHPQFSSRKSFSSTKRTCQNDPEDSQFMICKTIIKDDNGTREEEERLPVNSSFDFQNNGSFRNPVFDNEKTFDKFQSFFIQPSFFDFHNSAQRPNYNNQSQVQSFSRAYSQSQTCKSDPENQEYLICKSKITDENGTREVEQRVKASSQFRIPSFHGEFANFEHEIDRQMHNFMKEMNSGFNLLMPFVGSMVNLVNDLENLEKNIGIPQNQQSQHFFPRNPQKHQNKPNQKDSRYFSTSQTKKDTNIYDL